MGLHLNYELRLPESTTDEEVTTTLATLRAFALELPFRKVSPLYRAAPDGSESLRFFASIIARPDPEDVVPLTGDVATAQGFFVDPGQGCETAIFGFLRRAGPDGGHREWFWHCSCKTQYASIVSDGHLVTCHTGLVQVLDYAISRGVEVVVRDEAHYWETRDEQRLIAEVAAMNRIVASIAGKLSDAIGPERDVRAPIYQHPRFERLEMGEEP